MMQRQNKNSSKNYYEQVKCVKKTKIQQNNNIVFPVDNIPQASANSNVAGIASGKAKCPINAQKACQEQTGPADNSSINS